MLEITNLNKTYYPKDGKEVKALDNLSLKIQDKGLVFILGKSGSGKSTLLNLLGGLDTYDSGDIIIKGKSTKDFKQKDFDSYRNTLIGFVFQEYNLLDEFSVGANIALAIELQGRKATNEEVNRILAQVDLEGYGSRKTNELSGGQKQRIAIARALVKNPEIIFADEPTGALDSNTGLQIFEFLRNLSKDKLVIVVSHDREFAESFGDRVIELSDGQVISDIIKVSDNNNFDHSKNLNYNEKDGFIVKENYQLTNQDLKQINDYLLKHKSLKISAKKDLSESQKVFVKTDNNKLKIREDNKSFELVKSKLPLAMAFKMGASALNHKKVRLVITILLSMVAFVLFGIADTLASYNKVNAFTNSIIDNNVDSLIFSKEKRFEQTSNDYTYEYFEHRNSNYEDLEFLKSKTDINFKPVFGSGNPYGDMPFGIDSNLNNNYSRDFYYISKLSGLIELNQNELDNLGFTLHGNLPKEDNEIVIPTYIFEHFDEFGYRNENIEIKASDINNYNDVIGLNFKIRENYGSTSFDFIITGDLDTKFNNEPFQKLKNTTNMNYMLMQSFENIINYSYHSLGYLNEGVIDKLLLGSDNSVYINNADFSINLNDNMYLNVLNIYNLDHKSDHLFFDSSKTSLASNEIIIGIEEFFMSNQNEDTFNGIDNYSQSFYEQLNQIEQQFNDEVLNYIKDDYDNIVEKGIFDILGDKNDFNLNVESIYNYYINSRELGNNYFTKTYVTLYNEIYNNFDLKLTNNQTTNETTYENIYYNIKNEALLKFAFDNYEEAINNGLLNTFGGYVGESTIPDIITNYYQKLTYLDYSHANTFSSKSIKEILTDPFKNFISKNEHILNSFSADSSYNGFNSFDNNYLNFKRRINVVGINFEDFVSTHSGDFIIVDDNLFTTIKNDLITDPFRFFISKMPNNKNQINDFVKMNYENYDDYFYRLQNEVTPTINTANSLVEDTASIFLYIGIGFAVFAGLMLSNFIASSVNFKKREIGILRALGARSRDVFEIFLQESLLIAAINYITSLIGTIIAIYFINISLRDGLGLNLKIFNFGFRQVILLLLISLFVAIVASFFPVYRIAKKKPIDAITNK